MKIRWLIDIAGTVNGDLNGVRRGQVAEIDDVTARRYLANGYVTRDLDGDLPRPYRTGGA